MKRACPSCPDGSVWNRNGPTSQVCPTCGGKAYIGNDDEDEDDQASEDVDTDEIEIPW